MGGERERGGEGEGEREWGREGERGRGREGERERGGEGRKWEKQRCASTLLIFFGNVYTYTKAVQTSLEGS